MRASVYFQTTPDLEALRETDWIAAEARGAVDTRYVRRIVNCFDESALEMALRLSDARAARGSSTSLRALSIGGREVEPHLKTLQALGYERTARVRAETDLEFAPAVTAAVIAAYVRQVDHSDLVLLGCRDVPGDTGAVPFMVAEALGWPCLTQVIEIEPAADFRLRAAAVTDDAMLHLTLRLPCVLAVGNAVVSHLRAPTLLARLAARDERIDTIDTAALGIDIAAQAGLDTGGVKHLQVIDRGRAGVIVGGKTPHDKARTLFDSYLKGRLRDAVRFAAILNGTVGTGEEQTRALGAFVRDGPLDALDGETLVFWCDESDRERLVATSPTRDVRLIKVPARRTDRLLDVLTTVAREDDIPLFVFPEGPSGTELATRLAHRTGGSVLTEAVSIETESGHPVCRKDVYSSHMVGTFEMDERPWCVTLDSRWMDATAPDRRAHRVLSDTDETAASGPAPFTDLDVTDLPSAKDLAQSRFLVVAGLGAGCREGVERIASAARLMGASFGVSRPVVMNAWASLDHLVGVSGTRTSPALCLVAGASGAPALHWGIEEAQFIVAINTDEHAQIAANADVVVVDDGVAVLEALAGIIAAEGLV